MGRCCAGCGKEKSDRKKYCPECRAKLRDMEADGYLTSVPPRHAPTVFSDQRGRKIRPWHEPTVEDDYSEDSEP